MERSTDARKRDEQRADRPVETVESSDPSLSPKANRLLTDELRAAVGSDRAERREPDRPEHPREGDHGTSFAFVAENRLLLGLTLLMFVIIGVIVSLITGSWWALVGAVAIHALGVLAVAGGVIQLSTETEHVSPSVAATLEEEGVADPDRVLTDLAGHYGEAEEPAGVADVIAEGTNERDAVPERDPARATVEQRTAFTPTSAPSEPVGSEDRERTAERGGIIGRAGRPGVAALAVTVVVVVAAFMVAMGFAAGAL